MTATMMTAGTAMIISLSGCDYINVITGKETCRQWSDHRLAGDSIRKMNKDWANGFFPAFYKSAPKGRVLNFPAANAELLDSMDSYCDAHPEATIIQAATRTMADAIGPAQSHQGQ
jgi:hypothetical protein